MSKLTICAHFFKVHGLRKTCCPTSSASRKLEVENWHCCQGFPTVNIFAQITVVTQLLPMTNQLKANNQPMHCQPKYPFSPSGNLTLRRYSIYHNP